MFLGSAFTAYVIIHLLLNSFFFSTFLVSVLFVFALFLIFKHNKLNHKNQKEWIILAFGFTIGLSYALYLNASYADFTEKETASLKKLRSAEVIHISKKSVVVEFKENTHAHNAKKKYRVQVFDNIHELKLSKGSKVVFSCERVYSKRDDTFSQIQRLQKISASCRGIIQKEPKYIYSIFEEFRIKVKKFLKTRLKEFPENTLAAGFILADTTDIHPVEMHFFRKMGIAHLFAASGLHMGLLFLICYLPFVWLRIPLYGKIIGLIACTFFLILLDFPTSLLRAYLFLLIFLSLKFADRKTSVFYIFFFVACLSDIIFPLSAFSYSFILSFGVTGSILLSFPFFKKIIGVKQPYLRDHLSLTLSAFVGSSFLAYILFGYVNILSLIYNFLLVPLSGIYLFLALSGVVFLPVSKLLFFIDQVFHFSVYVHQTLWERFFTSTSNWGTSFWLALIAFFIVWAIILMSSEKKWYVRKWFLKVCGLLILVYFAQFFFLHFPRSGFKAFPYGVVLYEDKNLYLLGKVAPFIQEGQERFFKRPDVPVNKIYVSSQELYNYATKITVVPYEEVRNFTSQKEWNLLKWRGKCFIFMSSRFIFKKAYIRTQKCSSIYLISSKKYRDQLKKTYEKFKQERKQAKIFMNGFNRWQWYEQN